MNCHKPNENSFIIKEKYQLFVINDNSFIISDK